MGLRVDKLVDRWSPRGRPGGNQRDQGVHPLVEAFGAWIESSRARLDGHIRPLKLPTVGRPYGHGLHLRDPPANPFPSEQDSKGRGKLGRLLVEEGPEGVELRVFRFCGRWRPRGGPWGIQCGQDGHPLV